MHLSLRAASPLSHARDWRIEKQSGGKEKKIEFFTSPLESWIDAIIFHITVVMLDWEYSVTLPYGILFEALRYYVHVLFCPCEMVIHFSL